MKKSIQNIVLLLSIAVFSVSCEAQIKNAKKETVKISGNCEMCEETIEKAGNLKKIASVDWDKDTKVAAISYDETKTNKEEILKRIALAGYDSPLFLAPEDAYKDLPECCQYKRQFKQEVVKTTAEETAHNHDNHSDSKEVKQEKNQLANVFQNYFQLKDALVNSDGNKASGISKELSTALSQVKMELLDNEVHMVWMKVNTDLNEDAAHIADTKDIKHQRDHFITLSKNIYALMKTGKLSEPIYYQFCPMANDGKGANWLSKENAVKNPYYGSMMLTCGKTVETLK
ncbi:DUF3347 domain-containing protein [Flavobacterium amniphilum]|uniref:DUF3347 domain-containing protein n=1 Tax=Flavobacterium amniphilum TaxID=1834035 RepID=UPI00202AA143|nr:DUF3347 domain-containing protein [Flavobacterium amniphilum]MCL9804568.1 DUF3347 domain-containing protein [Flavobacterium amniphilum]